MPNPKQPPTSVLGQGSFGKVERVCWGDRWFARKTMLQEEHDEGLSYASLREIDIYSRFASPYMVSVYKIEIANHQICLWMSLADKSLADYIDESPQFADRLKVASDLLWVGLNFFRHLHAYGVLHRDFKPDNVLMKRDEKTGQYRLYVSDMGSSRWHHRFAKLTSGMGTQCYRPPEMLTRHYSKPSEVYCLGVSVIHLIHGQLPDGNEATPETWQRIWKTYQQYMPSTLYHLVRRMIYAKPQDRPTVQECLEHAHFNQAPLPPMCKVHAVSYPGDYTHALGVSHDIRRGWIEFMIDFGIAYSFSVWTLVHAVHLFDDFFAGIRPEDFKDKSAMELYAVVALWTAGKYFEEHVMSLSTIAQYTGHRHTQQNIIDAEERLVTVLRFRIVRRNPPKEITLKTDPLSLKQFLGSPDYMEGRLCWRRSPRIKVKPQ